MKRYPAENSSYMTAKKKQSSVPKPKTTKAKTATAKAPVKKTAKKAVPVKKSPAVKKSAAPKKAAVSKSSKAAKIKKSDSKVQVKTPSKPSRSAKAKTATGKAPAKKAPIKPTDTSSISQVKEIVSKSMGKSIAEDTKSESNSFSFEDVIGFLKAKKKEKPKAQVAKESTESKVAKTAKTKEKKQAKVKKLSTASIDDILGFGAPVVGVVRPLRDESKVPKQWLPYYTSLMSLRAALKGSLGERSSETIGASARESGELSINSSDAGTDTFDRDLAISMVANDQEALEEIEDAIDRIFAGTYGICLETNKPINKNRLKAVPFTRFSVEGQNQFERGKIKERDFGSGSFATLADSTMGEEE